jgi:hypothetical protein
MSGGRRAGDRDVSVLGSAQETATCGLAFR